jgi:hypothetical protein
MQNMYLQHNLNKYSKSYNNNTTLSTFQHHKPNKQTHLMSY